jgi:four helix bundle protein
MNFKEWEESVPDEIRNDPLWEMSVYQHAIFLGEITWIDISKMIEDERLKSISDQLIRAVGSISANIAEGYSCGSGKDQARFYEYALGSARESRGWYYQGRKVLGDEIVNHRLKIIEGIIRQLMTIIPTQRGYKIKEEKTNYASHMESLLSTIPLPEK